MTLNKRQKEIILKEWLDPAEVVKIFDLYSYKNCIEWLIGQTMSLKPSKSMNGWYDLIVEGEKATALNFSYHPEILEQIKENA